MTLAEIGEIIRIRRKQLNFTQQDIEELTGITKKTIRMLEKGETNISLSGLLKIIKALGFDLKIVNKINS